MRAHGYRARWGGSSTADFQRPADKYYGVTLPVDGKVGPETRTELRAHAL
ncbi:hypothetical protein ACIOHS_38030 [Streptomyces sp. NPDC088253]